MVNAIIRPSISRHNDRGNKAIHIFRLFVYNKFYADTLDIDAKIYRKYTLKGAWKESFCYGIRVR